MEFGGVVYFVSYFVLFNFYLQLFHQFENCFVQREVGYENISNPSPPFFCVFVHCRLDLEKEENNSLKKSLYSSAPPCPTSPVQSSQLTPAFDFPLPFSHSLGFDPDSLHQSAHFVLQPSSLPLLLPDILRPFPPLFYQPRQKN